jgi:hypothetical protein
VFSASGKILSKSIVIDNNTVFYDGVEIENSDATTFIKLDPDNEFSDFVDKNFYYYSMWSVKNRYHIPHWAYEEFKNGKLKESALYNIETKYSHTIYKEYWNGFLVTMKVPTKNNTDNKLYIEFKNIERKTLELDTPLEEKIFLFVTKEFRKSENNTDTSSIKLNATDAYNFKQIKPEEVITFTYELPTNVTDNNGLQYTFPYFITLSSKNQPERDNYNELYRIAEIKIKKQTKKIN